jgi:glycosyltransferase involved in cell wall biosynthesis
MKICHVITRLIVGGAQENTLLTCEGLAVRGHEVTLIAGPTAGPEGSLVDRARRGGYRYVEVPSLVRAISPINDAAAVVDLRAAYRELAPDIVHTHSSKAGIVGRLAAAEAGVPRIVHTIHGLSFNRTQPIWLQAAFAELERVCAARTHRFVSVADAMTRAALAAGIGTPDQYVTIYSGMEVERFDPTRLDRSAARRALNLPDDAIVVATVARLFRNKGYEQLIPAMSMAVQREPRLRFLWIGDGAQRGEYERELTRRGLRERTTLTGLVEPEKLPQVLCAADLLVHASLWEGLPRAVVQALLLEIPAIGFDLDGAPEVIRMNVTGLLVPPEDTEALADAIVALAADPRRRRELGGAGRAAVIERFDHRRMVTDIASMYFSLC